MNRNPAYTRNSRGGQLKLSWNRPAAVLIATGVAIVLAITCLVIHARASRPSTAANLALSPPVRVIASPLPLVSAARVQHDEVSEVRLVTVTPRGFEPDELLSKTRFTLAIDDLTGLDEGIQVQLYRQTGGQSSAAKLHEVRMPRGRMNWTKEFELAPGDYVLTESNHPNWTCKITVAAH